MKTSYVSIDRFRVAAAFLVVAIHTYPLVSFSETADFLAVHVLARIAVPFFFCVTGYFLVSGFWNGTGSREHWVRFLKKTILLYAASVLLYLPINWYAGHFKEAGWNPIKALLFDGTMYHLWYLPAALLGVSLLWVLSRRMGQKAVCVLSVLFYGIGLFGDSYYGITCQIPVMEKIYNGLFAISSYTRNGLFFAPVFLMMGAVLAGKKKRMPQKWAEIGLAVSLGAMAAEGLMLRAHKLQRHDSMYVFLLPAVYFLMECLFASSDRNHRAPVIREARFGRMLRTFSMGVYLIHPMAILLVRAGARMTGLTGILVEQSLVHYLAVVLISSVVSLFPAVSAELRRERKLSTGRAWMEIDETALLHNVQAIQRLLPKGCALMPAIKADGYGIGAVREARLLYRKGIRAFCVAAVKEGIELRRGGVRGEILILGYTDPEQFPLLKRYRLTQTVLDYEYAKRMNDSGLTLRAHVKIDTGMHRLGEESGHQKELLSMFRMKHLHITGIFTHLCVCDETGSESQAFTKAQEEQFWRTVHFLEKKGIKGKKLHLLSSYGIWNGTGPAGDYVRPGIGLLGVHSSPGDRMNRKMELSPVVSVKARVALVRELREGEGAGYGLAFHSEKAARLAVVSIGYADGIPRALSEGKGSVLIHGKRAPIAGRICMDQLLADVTDIPEASSGDAAVLIGTQGSETVTAEETAFAAGTITNELLCRMGKRLERVYVRAERE